VGLSDQTENGCQRILNKIKLKRGNLKNKVKGNLTATVWKEKWNINVLTNTHSPLLEGNFCDGHRKAVKPAITQDYIYHRHMGYVEKSDCMSNSNSISRWIWIWTKKMFFHLLDLTILNSFIILASCGSTPTIQTDIGGGPNKRGRKGASTTDCKTKKDQPHPQVN